MNNTIAIQELNGKVLDKRAFAQIRILRNIALLGIASKTKLSESPLLPKITTLDETMQKMELRLNLIQRFGLEEITKGKRPQIVYTLTREGIQTLLSGKYQENDPIDKTRNKDDPYLTKKEFVKFIALYFDKDSLYQKEDDLDKWENPHLSKKEIFDLYLNANPSLRPKLEQGEKVGYVLEDIEDEEAKFEKKRKEFDEKMNLLKTDLADMMYKQLTKNLRKKKGKLYRIKRIVNEEKKYIVKDIEYITQIIKGDWT